jgi:hypothetical protein
MRGQRVILDRDLAALYGVTTKRLNEAVKRNARRFRSSIEIRDFLRLPSPSTAPFRQPMF